jgi:hypothetical protein
MPPPTATAARTSTSTPGPAPELAVTQGGERAYTPIATSTVQAAVETQVVSSASLFSPASLYAGLGACAIAALGVVLGRRLKRKNTSQEE